MSMSATEPPWPSTMAFVASVVESETRSDGPVAAGQRPIDRLADAERQVVLGGERLGGGDDATLLVVKDRVGVGAAGIDSELKGQKGGLRWDDLG